MKYQTIAPHRRLVTKFAAMAVFLSLIPQVVIYLLASQTTSSVLLETLRTSLKEKSVSTGFSCSANGMFESSPRQMCSRVQTWMPSSSI